MAETKVRIDLPEVTLVKTVVIINESEELISYNLERGSTGDIILRIKSKGKKK